MKEWRGARLPEVPEEYRWEAIDKNPKRLVLRVVESDNTYPFVLWVWENDKYVNISPIGDNAVRARAEEGSLEDNLHVATTWVLLGMWKGEI